ncbi:ring-hydroxylating dioxygenase subunit beta [Mycobacterium paraintracellulare]|nr:ring-hydroxylating dioxygenase subunit beta [Mycobacterium paraintracellulare]
MNTNGGFQVSLASVSAFLYHEARLLDQHNYEEWLALWADSATYWIPADGEDTDPNTHVSFIYDNRQRLAMRVKQLQTGYRYAQLPQSRTQHFVTNIEILGQTATAVTVRSSYLIIEARFGEMHFWPGRATHELVVAPGDDFTIRRKEFVLINNDQPVTSMGFLP